MENTNNKQFRQIGFILIAIVLFASGCKKEAAESESIRPVFYQKISTSEGGNQFIIPGIVQYKQESKLSFKVGGVIRSKHVAVGQKVIKGSLLATIDDIDYEVIYKQAQASDKAVDAGGKSPVPLVFHCPGRFPPVCFDCCKRFSGDNGFTHNVSC